MTELDRRTFLAQVGAAAVLSATPGVPGVAAATQSTAWKRVPCRLCGVGCGLLVGIANGRAVAVKGDPDSPVSRGLACAKGYYSAEALAGRDRIRRALVRRGGALVAVPLSEAYDLVAERLQEAVRQHGKDAIALYGSAQWTVPDAYIASKLFKGALGTNNLETSTRLYGAGQRTGLLGTFGLDGTVGCYDDIEHADTIVLWDANLAESDPILFSRMLERKRMDPAVRIVGVATRTTRTSYAIDRTLLYAPHAALAVIHGVCQEVVARDWTHREFVERHVAFKRGTTGLGDGRTDDLLREDPPVAASWSEYQTFLQGYRPERAAQLSGLAAEDIRWLASLYGDPQRKVLTVWGRGLPQDIRGAWIVNALCGLHLLVGKVASPGNGPLGLFGQPGGGCGVHDAGSLTETLPRGVVQDEDDRRRAAAIWQVPVARLDPRPGAPALSLFRRLERGDVRFLWIQATDPMVSFPDLDRYRRAAALPDRFVVVSEAYPTPTTDVADVVLPAAMWFEREGIYANAERRLQHFERCVAPPGDAASDAWQMIEVARRLGFTPLFPYTPAGYVEQVWEEYGRFHAHGVTALPGLGALREGPGMQWPFVAGREVRRRYAVAEDPSADGSLGAFDFYGHADHRAWIWLRPFEPPAELPDRGYPFWLCTGAVLEHWGAGSMTQRIPSLHRALPHAYVELNRDDARDLGIRDLERVRLVSRRGAIDLQARIEYRCQPPRGQVFVPVFDESVPINRLMLDAACPISGQPDGAKCAVRVERIATGGAS